LIERFLVLLAMVAAISVLDFLSGRSSWQFVFTRIFTDQPSIWPEQVRWGFGRIAGSFGHAILAGIVFLIGLIYCLWLRDAAPEWGRRRIFARGALTVRGAVLGAIVAGQLMTQSRGPWIGAGLAVVLALLLRAMPAPRAAAVFALFLVVFGTLAYKYGMQYTEGDLLKAKSEAQQNAIYRRELFASYIPLIEQRPVFGWGITPSPTLNGQRSIDNQYLLLAVTQGYVGVALFLVIVLGSMFRLFSLAAQPIAHEDKMLVYAHMAVLIGIVSTITTVFLGMQTMPLFYLVAGWVQGMQPVRLVTPAGGGGARTYRFQRVLV
jgi:O-antigen ligase